MLHVDSNILSSVPVKIDEEYEKNVKMTITQGKIHKYLRIAIDYSLPGRLILSMVYYIGKILNYTPEDMRGESARLAASHVFDIAEDVTKLS